MTTKHLFLLIIILSNLIHQIKQSLVSNIFEKSSNDVFFQILSPESLRYTYRAKAAQGFGAPFNETLKLSLINVEPNNACTSIINKIELKNNVGLVARGGCSFLEKCIEAERTGLKAILVYDNNNANDDRYLDMIADSTQRNCSIHSAFILGRDGFMIKRHMLYMGIETLPILINVNISRLPENEKVNSPPWVLY